MRGRLLEVVLADPYANLALEEVLFNDVRVPTLRVWRNQKSVVIGRAQLAEFETDLQYCRIHSVPVVRRFTAGGAVYNGPGNLNWSFLIPGGDEGVELQTRGPRGVFESFASMVVSALKRCGSECAFKAPNSIVDGYGKVSGMAAYLSKSAVMCHGTLLVSADLEEVKRLTRPRDETVAKKYPRSRFAPVSNCAVDEVRFVRELVEASGYSLQQEGLTERESKLSLELASSKYRKREWTFGDPFALDDL
ncbi:MAG: lipoate--protein ligase family protein [Thaumarchaeota archaeon]|nr:lipoate--protein ligase family protein [Nitrososphaerota archaeon]